MACACKRNLNNQTYIHTLPSGKKVSYRSETEAKMAVVRKGGTYEKG